ncbi:hypothetical protein OQA88_4201 [Cercophora sp. LCS_1]
MGGNKDLDFNNLNEEDWKAQEAADNAAITQISNSFDNNEALNELLAGAAFDQSGKADDAVDYEDISDDDELPEEIFTDRAAGSPPDDEPTGGTGGSGGDLPGLTDDGGTSNDTDDLFGDGGDLSSPIDGHAGLRSSPRLLDADGDEQIDLGPPGESLEELRNLNFDHDEFDQANQDPNIPAPAENLIEAVKQAFPGFKENAILNWNEILQPKPAQWISKKPTKLPKPLIPSKLSLELDTDQEKQFRIPGPASSSVYQRIKNAETNGFVCLEEPESLEQADLEVFSIEEDGETEPERIRGWTLNDIATICDDWDWMIALGDEPSLFETGPADKVIKGEFDEDEELDDAFWDEPAAKRRRVEIPHGLPPIPRFTAPDFDNFEEATAKLGKRVLLDMNDPYLLIDDVESERATKRRKIQHKTVRMANGKLGRELTQRFNFSSDAAYDALKENNQNRVRATLASIPVEHSMTAQRMVWPYYKVKLTASDPHSYHRPQLHPRKEAHHTIRFSKPNIVKRKALKGKRVSEIFKQSQDLTMNDNSTAILFEYCEEVPTVLSNFGMGQKIINYFRRNKGGDARPEKRELGELCILMPEDRSPFAIFGHVHPGEVVPTLHNQMFRAPIFKHNPRATDFLVGRSTTGQGGSSWYIRNIDHLYVVGQTLPSMEVPGPHSRRVTNISKNRLKMIAYRQLHQKKHVTLADITRHIADSNESQNRQKLKEFLRFRKDQKDWVLPEGEVLMDEPGIRALIKPEEVCLLDAMQVGAHELENGGYEANDLDKDDVLDADESQPDTLAVKMTPWRTTKAFIDASHGKAMLAVHGAGDPTGKGLGISFLRTSMKGGYLEQLQGPLATSADAIEKQRKANGGHMYNVKAQDNLYTEAITDIWNRQRESLQDTQEHDDDDVLAQEDEDDRFNIAQSQVAATPIVPDGMSQISQSATSGMNRKKLKITREVMKDGVLQPVTEIVHDPVVIAQYLKRRRQQETENIEYVSTPTWIFLRPLANFGCSIYNAKLTGDPERDALILEV